MSEPVIPWDLSSTGIVHEGRRTELHRAVRSDGATFVLKVARPGCDDAALRQRLERELSIAGSVRDASVVHAFGMTTLEARTALVLEDFGGKALSDVVHVPMSPASLVRVASALAGALGVIHRQGIVHRDIKPSNVIYEPTSGTLKLTDFGIATARGVARGAASGSLEGTLAYIAPEQTGRLMHAVDHRADLYSLGVTLYELATGRRPFQAKDALEWIHCHLARVPRPPAQVSPDVPEVLSHLIMKLLAKAPEERYQSAEGLRHDLGRCAAELSRTGSVGPFPLGEADVVRDFSLPQRVYGREREMAALRDALAATTDDDGNALFLVSGHAGVGKSSLVRELEKTVARGGGFFATGKFDQNLRPVPYSAFGRAGRELVEQAQKMSADRLDVLVARLRASLAGTAGALAIVVPEIQALLGPLPAIETHRPSEAQHRIQFAVRQFLRSFLAPSMPLVLFLDDVQWADPSSLELLGSIFADRGLGPLLCVAAYRDGDVDPQHPFARVVSGLRADGVAVSSMLLERLDPTAVQRIVADTLRVSVGETLELSRLLQAKTEGNPFFLDELLRTLHLEGLLRFDPVRSAWAWDADRIAAREITEDVVELLVERLKLLSPASRETLCLAACIGGEIDLDDLSAVTEKSPRELSSDLEEPFERGLLVPLEGVPGAARARFRHDRVQQAALALIDPHRRQEAHLRIGGLLWNRLTDADPSSRLFDVANHLDLGFPEVVDAGERERLFGLMTTAARRAKDATAYAAARRYWGRAAELLDDDAWNTRYGDARDVHTELAECEYLAGELGLAGARFAEVLRRAENDLDRARVYYLQIRLFQVAGDFAEAAALSLRSFRLFGLDPPESDEDAARAVEEENRITLELLGDRPIADRLHDREMTDPAMRMLVDLLEASGPPIYMVRPALFAWVALKLVTCTLRFGNAPASAYGYGIYALLRAASRNDVQGGFELSQLAIRLSAKLHAVHLEGCMLHLLGDHVNFWKNPIATDLPILEAGFRACVRGGDHIYSNYIGFQSPWHLYESGAPLADVRRLTETYEKFAVETRYAPVVATLRIEQHFLRALTGEASPPGAGDPESLLAEVTAAQFGCGVVYFHILRMIERFTSGDHEGALAAAALAERDLGSAFSMPIYVSYCLFHGLALAARLHLGGSPAAEEERALLAAHARSMRTWAAGCPQNFAHKAALLEAELARLSGDAALAMRLYESARLGAREQGMVQYEALACELAAAFYDDVGVASVASSLEDDARGLYESWGAARKAASLPASTATTPVLRGSGRSTWDSSSTTSTSSRQLEVLPVVKAAQSLSAEMNLPRLLERLMAIVIEYAGAERGWLLLSEEGELSVTAHAETNELDAASPSTLERESGEDLPHTILDHVQRTSQTVLLSDARSPHPFSDDPYLRRGAHRSILCKPILRQGALIGVFYLENGLVPGAFNDERLAVLDVLASQTAISIENSRLYQASQAAVVARDDFLAIASHELKTPLTPISMQLQALLALLRKGKLAEVPEERLQKMATSCEAQLARLTRLVGSLLDVSRIGSGELDLERERVDLGALVAEVVTRHSLELERAGCQVRLHLESDVVGDWDRLRVEQIVTNVLLNAVKFGKKAPIDVAVTVRVRGLATLTVSDQGPGIREIDRERVFQRFERVRSPGNVDGMGLGLYIVRAIVEAHGGIAEVGADGPRGCVVSVSLPIEAPASAKKGSLDGRSV